MFKSFMLASLAFFLAIPFLHAQDGFTPATAFIDFGQVNRPGFPSGNYYFNIGGVVFTTEVDAGGWVMIASADPNVTTGGPHPTTTALTFQADALLPASAYVGNSSINELRISATMGAGGPLDVTSSHPDELGNLFAGVTLTNGYTNANHWTGVGASPRTNKGSCNGNNLPLNESIFHACQNGAGMHWQPHLNRETIDFNPGAGHPPADLVLWVRAPRVGVVVPTVSEWGLIALILILATAAVVVLARRKKAIELPNA